ncbi:MAG: hypothetical protein J6V44_03455 [Methanobrevibacter sp.]|nr:hypothetical protein [Methanobrevibacter sp.]
MNFHYPKISSKKYDKTCLKCGRKYITESKNKRLCDNCAYIVANEKNNQRVKKHQKYKKSATIGTGRLNGKRASNNFDELDNIIGEMKYLRLI